MLFEQSYEAGRQDTMRDIAHRLYPIGFSYADIAQVFGLSKQRVQQIMKEESRREATSARRTIKRQPVGKPRRVSTR